MKSTRESLWAVEAGDRPREKLQRLGPAGLSDAELVALVLGSGLPGVNVLDSAASLLRQAGGVHELMAMTVRELRALVGVGIATAGRVVAVSELWRRAHDPLPGRTIENPADLVDVVRAFVASRTPPPVPGCAAEATPSDGPGVAVLIAASPSPPCELSEAPSRDDLDEAPPFGPPLLCVVVADDELRVRVVVPLTHDAGESIASLVPRVLHEVLYRGGSAFALAVVEYPEPGAAGQGPGAEALRSPHPVAERPASPPHPNAERPAPRPASSPPAEGGVVQLGEERREELRALRDVMKLAASTVGLRYLSTVVIAPNDWAMVD